jgi:hypothetical protein
MGGNRLEHPSMLGVMTEKLLPMFHVKQLQIGI